MRHAYITSTIVFLLVIFSGMAAMLETARLPQNWKSLSNIHFSDVVDGRAAAIIDRAAAAGLPRLTVIDGWVNGAIYALTKDAGPQVRSGCEGWLFLAEETIEVENALQHAAARLQIARRIQALLAGRGVELVMLPVPDKVAQAKEELCDLHVAEQAKTRANIWREASAELGLEQVDLTKGWPQPGYWRTDTHWDRSGARFAAAQVSEVVIRKIGIGSLSVRLQANADELDRYGDLMKLAGLVRTSALFGPLPDRERIEVALVEHTGGLLDDTPAPSILLAGSSYSLNSGFIDYLQVALSSEVVQKSQAGGGFAGALLDVIQNNPSLLDQVNLIVWEWPMRALTQPLTKEEKQFLTTLP
jgi:alginate O-acetyltransferase complex protein AlgJ